MEDHIVAKIRAEMERGIKSECQAVYLLVEIRKLLDRDQSSAQRYKSLRLFGNWVVHVRLDNDQAQEIVRRADAFYVKLVNGTLSHEEITDFARILEFNKFRDELSQFLQTKRLRPFSDVEWNLFLTCYLQVIEDCPLYCVSRDASVTEVDEVVLIREDGRNSDGTPPAITWALCWKGQPKTTYGGTETLSDKTEAAIRAFHEAREQ
jgi:hypothetical protein